MTESAPETVETCRNGHPWTPENTLRRVSSGKPIRQCRTCAREAAQRRSAAKRGPTTTNLPEGVTDTFTFTCQCGGTVHVVGGVQRPHDCPLTEAERQAIRDATADAS